MGMSPRDYWEGSAELPRFYRQAHEIKAELRNENAWLLGMYICQAAACAIHGKKAPYPAEPYPLNTAISRQREARRQEANEQKVVDYLNAWAETVNRKFAGQNHCSPADGTASPPEAGRRCGKQEKG